VIDAQGRLIGMTNAYYRGTAVGLAVPVEMVRDFVEHLLPKKK
jgi:S1-C subfamily serine protease